MLPQADFSTFANQIFWLIVHFGVLYMLLVKVGLPQITSMVAKRETTIQDDMNNAEKLRNEADYLEAAGRQEHIRAQADARKMIDEIKAEVDSDINAQQAKLQQTLVSRMDDVNAKIAAERTAAMSSMTEIVQEAAALAYKELTGDVVDSNALKRLVESRVRDVANDVQKAA